MYAVDEIKKIIEDSKLQIKLLEEYKNGSCLISVEGFKAYRTLFGDGRTEMCYSKCEKYWKEYHQHTNRELVYLNTSKSIDKKYSFITFCFCSLKIDESVISGHLCVHDLNHTSYYFHFKADFGVYNENAYLRNQNITYNVYREWEDIKSCFNLLEFMNSSDDILYDVLNLGLSEFLKEKYKFNEVLYS